MQLFDSIPIKCSALFSVRARIEEPLRIFSTNINVINNNLSIHDAYLCVYTWNILNVGTITG